MFKIITRASMTFAFVWLMIPHQPDLGLGRPQTIDTLLGGTTAMACAQDCGHAAGAVLGTVASIENSHNTLLETIARVRGDLRANGTQIGALSRNGAL